MTCMLLILLMGCDPPSSEPTPEREDHGQEDSAAPEMEELFSFVVLADPHLSDNLDHEERMAAAVAWVNQEQADRDIRLVFVVGDIGWSGGLETARDLLDQLSVPYLPVIGDNEIYLGDELVFDEVMGPVYAARAEELDEWRRGAVEVVDTVGETLWLQNFSFSYEGLRWVGLDWCSRSDEALASELAELHDIDDGTFPYLEEELSQLPEGPEEDVLLFSHHPMFFFPGGFVENDWEKIVGLVSPVGHRVAGAYAGHLHIDYAEAQEEAGYDLFITDALWDDDVTVRVVTVSGDGQTHQYAQELVVVQ